MTRHCAGLRRSILTPGKLFAAVAAVLGIDSPVAAAVTSCLDDGGIDTLRHAVLVANDGDTIDLSALTCSKITLASAIATGLPNLTIVGPGADRLTIDGNQVDRVFVHSPALTTDTLTISNLTIAHGTVAAGTAYGGCIYSKGSVVLRNAVVTACSSIGQSVAGAGGVVAVGNLTAYSSVISGNSAQAQVGTDGSLSAIGGGAFAVGSMRIYGSVISGNTAQGATGLVYGGGIASASQMTLKYSTVSGNHAVSAGTSTNLGLGGGVEAPANAEIFGTTIDNNVADGGGGIQIFPKDTYSASIVQTTISSNTGNLGAGGVLVQADTKLLNSTIAFNVSGPEAGAVLVEGPLTATSTIIADNSPGDIDASSATTIQGDHDLIKVPGAKITVPDLTISLDPDLGPLAYNGGSTRTHALGAGSIAIGAGSNPGNLANDQRGPPYARVVGATDIGAYEFDADHIFGSGFQFGPLYP